MKRRPGRPTRYTEDLATEVVERLATGAQLREVSQEIGVPASTICGWVADRDDFRRRFHTAFAARAWVWAAELVGIVDGIPEDADMARVQRERVRFDARRWLVSKLLKEFADRTEFTAKTSVQILLPDNERLASPVLEGSAIEVPDDDSN